MSELKNSFHTELAIGILINDEKELEAKLNLLTEIGLTATSKETFSITEKFRARLCGQEMEDKQRESVSRIYKREANGNSGTKECETNNGDE